MQLCHAHVCRAPYSHALNFPSPDSLGTLQYFKNVGKQLATWDKLDEEERSIFLNNVFDEIRSHEYRLAVNPNCSKVLERLFELFTPSQIKTFLVSIKSLYLPLFTDRVASHAMQALLFRLPELMLQEFETGEVVPFVKRRKPEDLDDEDEEKNKEDEDQDSENHQNEEGEDDENDNVTQEQKRNLAQEGLQTQDWFLRMCVELQPHWLSLITSTHGSFIMRTILLILAGHTGLTKDFVASAGQTESKSNRPGKNGPASKMQKTADNTPSAESRKNRILGQSRSHIKRLRGVLPSIVSAFEDLDSATLKSLTIDSPSSAAAVVALLTALAERQRKPEHRAVLVKFLSQLLMWKRDDETEDPEGEEKSSKHDGEDGWKKETIPKAWKLKSGSVKHVNALFVSPIGSHLIEGIISSAPQYFLAELFNKHMLNRLQDLARDRCANHCIQRLLETVTVGRPGLTVLSRIIQGLATPTALPMLVAAGRSAIIWKMAGTIVRFATTEPSLLLDDSGELVEDEGAFDKEEWSRQVLDLQFEFVRSLAEATGARAIEVPHDAVIEDIGKIRRRDREACAPFLPRLLNLNFVNPSGGESKYDGNPRTNQLMGSLLIQELLKLGPLPNLTLAASAMALEKDDLLKMLSDSTAVRMVEAMLCTDSPALRAKDRKKIALKLEGSFTAAALAGPACPFLIEKLYLHSDTEVRTAILKDLSADYRRIASDRGGLMLLRNIKVQEYMQTYQVWDPNPESQEAAASSKPATKSEKVSELFSDLLGTKRKGV